ncbi:MAG: MoaD/ThiS family protein [Oscillospiraceae bacterium]|nr:MoaD/ThiS family protein [Oscillospiraceae bacterium]
MRIQVRSVLDIAKILTGRKIFVDLPEQSTLRELLRQMTDIYGREFYDAVCDESGYRANKVAILVNGANIAAVGGVDINLKDGDDVLILPMISGG